MKLTLERKILGGFVICCLVLSLVAVVSYRNGAKLEVSNQWVAHTHEVLSAFEQVLVHELDAETAERGYIITGNTDYLNAYNQAIGQVSGSIAQVKSLTGDNRVQQANIRNIQQLTDTVARFFGGCIRARETLGFDHARDLLETGTGNRLVENLRSAIGDAMGMEQALLVERRQVSTADSRSFDIIFAVLLVLIGIVLIAVYVVVRTNLRALKKAEHETGQKNWALTGTGRLTRATQGNMRLEELSRTIIQHLAEWVDAQAGALYVVTEDGIHFKLRGTYPVDTAPEVIRRGQGLAGQAAQEKRTITVTDIPHDHFTTSTSFGQMTPHQIMAVPVIFEADVLGIIELGAVRRFSAIQQEYIEAVVDNIAVTLSSSLAREKAAELLEETQRQAEELETQQEELRQTNEELHEKTDLLERSEAELKAQQEELQQTNEELGEKAALLEEQKEKLETVKLDLEAKAVELEQTSRYKSEFLANMSHELRTPLNSILILSQLLMDNKNQVLGEKEVTYAKNVHTSGTELLTLINDILDLSKVEAGKLDMDIARVDIGEVTANLRILFTELAKKRSIEFSVVHPEGNLTEALYSDSKRLEQILRNFLSNAFKFTESGGKVTLEMDMSPAGEAIFSVTDTGIGIPKDKQHLIFQAFQQADGSTKRKYGGTGLGLSISRELANALGGRITLQSEEGKGSRFTLYLPVGQRNPVARHPAGSAAIEAEPLTMSPWPATHDHAAAAAAHNTPADDRHIIGDKDRVVLIIEDDAQFASVLLDFFRERNYKGIIAHQGNTGLSLARHYHPDAIMLDMQLPVMDGSEVLRQLKNDPALRHIPVQIFSGYDRRKESLELGAFDFIRKPVSREAVQEAMDRIEDFIVKKLKRLLIVEDNKEQNTAICELIGDEDVQCFSAYSGAEAYKLLQTEPCDCIIIDLGLPDMSGIQLLEQIKANEELNRIPVIVYTGKDLTKEEAVRLNRLANTVVLKTATSTERLLDEAILFLHRVESKLPKEKQQIIRKLHRSDEVLKNKKVLIVDDDMRNIYSLTNALEEEGLQCMTAENGRESIQKLNENPDTDIVLMDIMMPGMDGYEATREIRRSNAFARLPIIALTAKAMKGDREKCLEAGMSDYIAKPVNIDQLLSLMRVWLYR